MNMMSPGSMTMTRYNYKDLLHCVVTAGEGERVTLVSPYQRGGMEVGRPISVPKVPLDGADGAPPPEQGDGGEEGAPPPEEEEQNDDLPINTPYAAMNLVT
jgi:hypothetical protein